MTDEELAAIEARANAATPGPWQTQRNARNVVSVVRFGPGGFHLVATVNDQHELEDGSTTARMLRDADFLCEARTDVPALLAEVRRLRAALADAIAVADSANRTTDGSERLARAREALR